MKDFEQELEASFKKIEEALTLTSTSLQKLKKKCS